MRTYTSFTTHNFISPFNIGPIGPQGPTGIIYSTKISDYVILQGDGFLLVNTAYNAPPLEITIRIQPTNTSESFTGIFSIHYNTLATSRPITSYSVGYNSKLNISKMYVAMVYEGAIGHFIIKLANNTETTFTAPYRFDIIGIKVLK